MPTASRPDGIELSQAFELHEARQAREVSRERLLDRAATVRPAGRFRFDGHAWQPQPYAGHAVVTMVAADPANRPLSDALADLQRQLASSFARPDAFCPLPPPSWHQTIANTLSGPDSALAIARCDGVAAYQRRIGDGLAGSEPADTVPLRMRLGGVGLFRSAIAVLATFERAADFHRVLAVRDRFYGHRHVAEAGIRETRPFVGHVTLGYVETALEPLARAELVAVIHEINETLARRPLSFVLPFAEARAYEHLAEFRALAGLPVAPL